MIALMLKNADLMSGFQGASEEMDDDNHSDAGWKTVDIVSSNANDRLLL